MISDSRTGAFRDASGDEGFNDFATELGKLLVSSAVEVSQLIVIEAE